MATIYKFEITQKIEQTSSGRKGDTSSSPKSKSASKKGKKSLGSASARGGVEHNRKMRAINPLINKATHGYWEKGMRVGRAGLGLVKFDENGKFAGLSNVAVAIIVSFAIQTFLKIQNEQREHARQLNKQNFNMLESGAYGIRGEYDIAVNLYNSRATYNQNK